MIRIRKGPEPKSWAEYRLSTPGATFDDAPKVDLRRALLSEQGYLCCYCMRRIDEDTTRIEHRIPREKLKELRFGVFDYWNLLAACDGGEGLTAEQQHCDVLKHHHEIALDPAHPSRDVETRLRYSVSGAIDARDKDQAVRHDLNVTLNLNLEWIRDARLDVLQGFLDGFERKHQGSWSAAVIERELKKWTQIPRGGKLAAYAGIVVHYLKERLRRVAAR